MGNITRAVIELSDDIRSTMPLMQRAINGCGYNPEVPVAAFRYKNMGVIVYSNEIIVNNAGNEATAQTVIDFLGEINKTANEKVDKVEVN